MKIEKILDNVHVYKADYGVNFLTRLEVNGKLQKEYCGIDENPVLVYPNSGLDICRNDRQPAWMLERRA